MSKTRCSSDYVGDNGRRTGVSGISSDGYQLDFGSRSIHDDVVPNIVPKILERLRDALTNIENPGDAERLQRIANALEETQPLHGLPSCLSTPTARQLERPMTFQNSLSNPTKLAQPQREWPFVGPTKYTQIHAHCEEPKVWLNGDASVVNISNDIDNREQHVGSQNSPKTAHTVLVIFTAVAVFILISSGTVYVLCALTNREQMNCIPYLLRCFSNERSTCTEIVSTYEEYNRLAVKRKWGDYFISIKLDHVTDWPAGAVVAPSLAVRGISLSGPLHVKKLVHLLSQTPNVESLHLNNLDGRLCSESLLPVPATNLKATAETRIKRLILDNFSSSCGELLMTLAESKALSEVKEIVFQNGIINDNVVDKLLRQNQNTIEQIRIANSVVETPLFSSAGHANFPKVTTVSVDVPATNTTSLILPISSPEYSLGVMFPNLQHFAYGGALISLHEFSKLHEFKYLKTLRVSVELPKGKHRFDVSFLSHKYPFLESAEIAVGFSECLAGADGVILNYFEGLGKLPDSLRANLRMNTNCETKSLY